MVVYAASRATARRRRRRLPGPHLPVQRGPRVERPRGRGGPAAALPRVRRRACVRPDFGPGAVIALLWAALLRYLDACESRYIMGCASVGLGAGHDAAAAICGRLCEEHLGPAPWRVFPYRPFPIRGWSRET